jgi:predicted nucleic acid-binding protein
MGLLGAASHLEPTAPDGPGPLVHKADGAGTAAARVVFDTNVVLDWLWFGDPRVQAVAGAVRAGRLHWLGSAPMRDELAAVMARGHLPERGREPSAVLAEFDQWCRLDMPAPAAPLRCSDPDDQKFVDLALGMRATALFTRDRCVLRLARPARTFGLWVGTPESWGPEPGGVATTRLVRRGRSLA